MESNEEVGREKRGTPRESKLPQQKTEQELDAERTAAAVGVRGNWQLSPRRGGC